MDAPFLIELLGGRYDGELRALPAPAYDFVKLALKRPIPLMADFDCTDNMLEQCKKLRYVDTMRTRGNVHIFALVE